MVVKDNHPLLRKKIQGFFDSPTLYEAEFHRATLTTTGGRGRVETRAMVTSADLPRGFTGFAGVRQLFRLERTVEHNRSGKVFQETVFGMTSLPRSTRSAAEVAALVQGHWTIENRSHYVRDVTFGEDASQVRVGSAPQVMAALRNMAVGLIRLSGLVNVAAARRLFAARHCLVLKLLGCPITE
jgi:predicted transposase YbfD/YdcC